MAIIPLMPANSLLTNSVQFCLIHAIQIFEYETHPPLMTKFLAMTMEKIPVKEIKGTGSFPNTGLGIIGTGFTIITHFVDVIGRSGIGFGGQNPPISILSHANNICLHNPVIGIYISTMKSVFNFLGFNPGN